MFSKRRIAVSLGDTHGGSLFGLMRPGIEIPRDEFTEMLEDETPHREPFRPAVTSHHQWMYNTYMYAIDEIKHLAGKDDILVIHGGDITHGAKHADAEKVSPVIFDQWYIAFDSMRDLLELPNVKWLRIVKGTGSHVFSHGTSEMIVAELLRREYPKKDINVSYQYLLDAFGVEYDIAHHGPGTGIRNWTKGNVLRLYTKSAALDALDAGKAPPDVMLRYHYHEYCPETVTVRRNGTTYYTRCYINPGFHALDDYARKATKSKSKTEAGMLAWEIVDGKLRGEAHEFIRTADMRTRETIE